MCRNKNRYHKVAASAPETLDQSSPVWLSTFLFVLFFFSRRRVEATKLNNNKFWHMEKYFCGESLSSSLLSSQCVRRQRNTKSSPPGPEEEPQTELNDTRSRHETRFIIYRQEISGFSHSTSVFWVKGVEWSGRCYKKATPIFVAHFLLWSPHKLSFLIPEQCFWIHLLQRMHIFFFFCIMSFFFITEARRVLFSLV